MGLGKTIQAIAAMNHLYHKGHRYFFVICPASLLLNWKREVEKLTDMQAYILLSLIHIYCSSMGMYFR